MNWIPESGAVLVIDWQLIENGSTSIKTYLEENDDLVVPTFYIQKSQINPIHFDAPPLMSFCKFLETNPVSVHLLGSIVVDSSEANAFGIYSEVGKFSRIPLGADFDLYYQWELEAKMTNPFEEF